MHIPFQDLPESSRVWIYQCNRTFSEQEQVLVKQKLETFLENWSAHGIPLQAGYEIPYNRFIVIAVNTATQAPTGCAIDASVRLIQELEADFKVDLLDRMNVSFKSGAFVAYKNLIDFKKMIKDKSVSASTIVFNNLVTNKAEYQNHWEVPMDQSWHSRYLK